MKRPSFFGGILFAIAAGISIRLCEIPLHMFLGDYIGTKLALSILYLSYVSYLFWCKRSRVGTISLLTLNALACAGLFILPISVYTLGFSFVGLVSLNRDLLFHRSLYSWIGDSFIASLGLTFATYLLVSSASLSVSAWGFFLVQALIAFLPPRLGEGRSTLAEPPTADPFAQSFRNAEAAFERIVY